MGLDWVERRHASVLVRCINDGTGSIESEVSIVGQVGSCNPIEAGTFNISISPEPTIARPRLPPSVRGRPRTSRCPSTQERPSYGNTPRVPCLGRKYAAVINHTLTNVGTPADLATHTLNVKNPVCPGQPTVVEVEVLVPNQALSGGQACDGEAIAGQE